MVIVVILQFLMTMKSDIIMKTEESHIDTIRDGNDV